MLDKTKGNYLFSGVDKELTFLRKWAMQWVIKVVIQNNKYMNKYPKKQQHNALLMISSTR